MIPTLNDLPEATRAVVVPMLQARVSDARDLYLAAKTAHWNVRGPTFLQLHKLFDKVAGAALRMQDALAELALSMGGSIDAQGVSGGVQPMPVLPGDSCAAYVVAVAQRLAGALRDARASAGAAMELDDLVTSDVLIKAAGELQRLLYLVERHR